MTLYTAMALMGCAGIAIGGLTFLRIRRLDTTLAAVLSAMTFSLPALRNIMPGTPPLGVLPTAWCSSGPNWPSSSG